MRDDAELMAEAADAGLAARRRTAPNPWVGCVVVRDGTVVGAGATEPPGRRPRRDRARCVRRATGRAVPRCT